MTVEVHVEWNGETRRAGSLHPAGRGPAVTFVYADEWLRAPDAFALDPTNLPLRAGAQHSPVLFGAFQDCGPDRWGRLLIERAVRREVLPRQAYQDLDFVLALDDASGLARCGSGGPRIHPSCRRPGAGFRRWCNWPRC